MEDPAVAGFRRALFALALLIGLALQSQPLAHVGSPDVFLEAMAFGLPVLAADVFGVSEVVEDGTNGWLFEARNGAAVSAAIAEGAG